MNDDEVRRAFLRIADPFGTRPRAVLLTVSLSLVAGYAALRLAGGHRTAVIALTVLFTVIYGGLSHRARRSAAVLTPPEMRARFTSKARGTLQTAALLPVRGLLWAAFGAWAGAAATGLAPFALTDDRDSLAFIAGAAALFTARYLLEWLVEVPRIRLELAALAESAPGGGTAPTPPHDPPPVDPS
jgi:hypothetical protein